jgi:hypothetical protein
VCPLFDSVNGKVHVTKERLYSDERKRGRALGISKEVVGQQKSMERQKQQRKAENSSKPCLWIPRRRRRSQRYNHKVRQMALVTDWQF